MNWREGYMMGFVSSDCCGAGHLEQRKELSRVRADSL